MGKYDGMTLEELTALWEEGPAGPKAKYLKPIAALGTPEAADFIMNCVFRMATAAHARSVIKVLTSMGLAGAPQLAELIRRADNVQDARPYEWVESLKGMDGAKNVVAPVLDKAHKEHATALETLEKELSSLTPELREIARERAEKGYGAQVDAELEAQLDGEKVLLENWLPHLNADLRTWQQAWSWRHFGLQRTRSAVDNLAAVVES